MAKNRISDLRDHLFAALEGLRDKDDPMELERAKAISDVAQVIINSAKVEVELLRAISGSTPASGFFELPGSTEGRNFKQIEPSAMPRGKGGAA